MQALDMIVNRSALDQMDHLEGEPSAPDAGEVTLRIDCFALTSNNVTYAVAPEEMGYWDFYPTTRSGWGRVPVWGFAEVIASAHPDVQESRRVYGFLPMSRFLTLKPQKASASGFSDLAPHRAPMAPIYSHYASTASDPSWCPEDEGLISLFRPLFMTAYLLADEHLEHHCYEAEQVLVSSASSKTAIAMVAELKRRSDVPVVGLTSTGNMAFCEHLGLYDSLFSYQDLTQAPQKPTAFVDMAGNVELIRKVYAHLQGNLKNACRVGLTHWQVAAGPITGLPDPKPYFFFAPTVAQQRIQSLGRDAFMRTQAKAQSAFLKSAQDWIKLEKGRGPEALKSVWSSLLSGQIDPSVGHVLTLRSE